MKSSVGLSLPEYSYNTSNTVLIIGAGLAGCAIAHCLAKRGYSCKVYDQHQSPGAATSAIPVAVVRPALSGDSFFKSYFNHAFDLFCKTVVGDAPNQKHFTQCGSLELTDTGDENSFSNYKHEFVNAIEASAIAGVTLNHTAIHIKDAGFINPPLLCEHWLQHKALEFIGTSRVRELRKTQHGWQLLSGDGTVIDESRVVVLATADSTDNFDVATALPLHKAAGQIDLFKQEATQLQCIINGDGYMLPEARGIWCGATHHPTESRQLPQTNSRVTCADSEANKARAASTLPALSTTGPPLQSFAAVRTFTPDRLPIVGALHNSDRYQRDYADLKHGKPADHYPNPGFHNGLYIATGLGSRGATQALLIGELISDLVAGTHLQENPDNPVHHRFLKALHPGRFLVRALKRG